MPSDEIICELCGRKVGLMDQPLDGKGDPYPGRIRSSGRAAVVPCPEGSVLTLPVPEAHVTPPARSVVPIVPQSSRSRPAVAQHS